MQDSVGASDVHVSLPGFRSLFTGMHHLPPDLAQKVLTNAVKSRRGIGAFEVNERGVLLRRARSVFRPPRHTVHSAPYVAAVLIPLVPLATMWDGFASNVRTYSLAELERLTTAIPTEPGEYGWETGKISARNSVTISYLLGLPSSGRDPATVGSEEGFTQGTPREAVA